MPDFHVGDEIYYLGKNTPKEDWYKKTFVISEILPEFVRVQRYPGVVPKEDIVLVSDHKIVGETLHIVNMDTMERYSFELDINANGLPNNKVSEPIIMKNCRIWLTGWAKKPEE